MTTVIRNEQAKVIGSFLESPDGNGNPRFETSSIHRPDAVKFWTKTAARFWLDVVDSIESARLVRGARS